MNYFVSAIGTDSGKTLVSAVLVEALKADYWKPVQAGFPRDTDTVRSLVSNSESRFFQEDYLLKMPASPHAAAADEGVTLSLDQLYLPTSENDLIVEGAGGLMVPLNNKDFIVDLPVKWDIPLILVANLYLGSINHTLLSVEMLKQQGVKVEGIVFNGSSNRASEEIILHHSNYKVLLRVPELEVVDKEVIRKLAKELLNNWQ